MMTYREKAIEILKIACQDTMDRAEEIITKMEGITEINIVISIPTLSDDPNKIPAINIMTNAFTSRTAINKIKAILHEDME